MIPVAILLWSLCAAVASVFLRCYLPVLRARAWGWWVVNSLKWDLARVMRIADKERRDAAFVRWFARMQRFTKEAEEELDGE